MCWPKGVKCCRREPLNEKKNWVSSLNAIKLYLIIINVIKSLPRIK